MPQAGEGNAQPGAGEAAAGAARVRFNSADVESSNANVCNATSAREEVVLNFGLNNSWERVPQELEVDLLHRIVVSPQLLSRLLAEYDTRCGPRKS